MPDVTIPAEAAKQIAEWFRAQQRHRIDAPYDSWADLLDPPPASLREQVAEALIPFMGEWGANGKAADAVLAVVADWLAAQPLDDRPLPEHARYQRAADVALIRGGAAKDEPRCSAHGRTLAQHEADLSEPDCNYQSDRCQCSVYAETGMHWDTCPGRGRFARGGAS